MRRKKFQDFVCLDYNNNGRNMYDRKNEIYEFSKRKFAKNPFTQNSKSSNLTHTAFSPILKEEQLKSKESDESKIRYEWEIADRLINKLRYVSPNGVKVYLAISSFIILKDTEVKITYSLLTESTKLDHKTVFLAVRELVLFRLIANKLVDGISVYRII
jgi:hypothetical protein